MMLMPHAVVNVVQGIYEHYIGTLAHIVHQAHTVFLADSHQQCADAQAHA